MFAHLFDARSPTFGITQLPVSARVEIDVDIQKARWFESWVAQRRRVVEPSVISSHWRGESRTTFHDDHTDDRSEQLPVPRPRHVPRQLSLLDRFESGSVASTTGHGALREEGPPESLLADADFTPEIPTAVPANIPDPDERLARRVKSWRASSSVAPSPMAATGQVSLDPVNMPNGIDLPSPPGVEEMELRLEDFQWSVSSEGPGDYLESLGTPEVWSRLPSVHLGERVEGSLLLSPSSNATSWGPTYLDDDYQEVSASHSYFESVDIGRRVQGSVMLSPSVATSQGPEDYDYNVLTVPSPRARFGTPDIADRHFSDVPPTPSTGTSWGPDDRSVDSYSVASHRWGHSPHMADRQLSDVPPTPSTATSWGPGSYAASEASSHRRGHRRGRGGAFGSRSGLSHVWSQPDNLDVGSLVFPEFQPTSVSQLVWPYFSAAGHAKRGESSQGHPQAATSTSIEFGCS